MIPLSKVLLKKLLFYVYLLSIMALCVRSDMFFLFGSYPKVLQNKYHSNLGVVITSQLHFWWILLWPYVTFSLHDSPRITVFLLWIRTQRWWSTAWELNSPAPTLPVMEKVCLPERMKNVAWKPSGKLWKQYQDWKMGTWF